MAKSKELIVVPYIGEFGWELMNWQARIRWLGRFGGFARIIVCATPECRRQYVDDNANGHTLFCPMPPCDVPGRANDDHRLDRDNRPIAPSTLAQCLRTHVQSVCEHLGIDTSGAELFTPSYRSMMWPTTPAYQWFTSLRLPGHVTTDIVLVPHYRGLATERNRPESWWEELAAKLRLRGLTIEIYEPRTDKAIAQLSRCRLAVGASTDGLHLASLCCCPQYVWGSGCEKRRTRMKITNRQRFETVWNPLGTPCRYDECGWRPPMERVIDAARRALDEIGTEVGDVPRRRRLNPKWRLKRGFARLLEPGSRDSIWPWRVRQAVRQHIV